MAGTINPLRAWRLHRDTHRARIAELKTERDELRAKLAHVWEIAKAYKGTHHDIGRIADIVDGSAERDTDR